jgi:raffinose/stachyose/melibiose transport system substrate-binding protein
MKKLLLSITALVLMFAPSATAQDPVALTFLVGEGTDMALMVEALTKAFTEANPNITVNIEYRPGGADGDNLVKTRLATGEMADIFQYNSGSLLQALNPAQTLLDITEQPFMGNVVESFLPTVTQNGQVFGIPFGTAMGGGIMYNIRVYEKLGLEVPKTWDAFVANNKVIADAGITPVLGTFGDTWTSQLFVLADYYNVEQAEPGFAERYTGNEAKYADTPAALAGFAYMQQANELGWFQADYATTKYEQGLALLASGEVAHYPMLTFAVQNISATYPEAVNDIGFFAQPGASAEKNGATIWMPSGVYIPQTTEGDKREAALTFMNFLATPQAADIMNSVVPPAGPYLIKGADLPEDVPPTVQNLAAYIDSGNSYPALEFVSPIKGPNLEQLLVSVGTGQMTAAEAAANYDLDVERQAQQLGLPGW